MSRTGPTRYPVEHSRCITPSSTDLAQTGNTNSTQGINASAVLAWHILPGLTYSGTFGGSLSSDRSFVYAAEQSYYITTLRGYDYWRRCQRERAAAIYSVFPFGGIANPGSTSGLTYTVRNQLDFNHNFFGGRDQLTVTAIQELRSTKTQGTSSRELGYYPDRGQTYYSAYCAGLNPNPLLRHYVQTSDRVDNTMSWIGIASYRFKKRYTVNANIRTDGNNRFGQYANQKFLPNWSVSGRWDIGEEPWLAKSDILSGWEMHLSYGTQGNVVTSVGPNLIAGYPQSPADPSTNEYILSLKSLPYPDLRWGKDPSMEWRHIAEPLQRSCHAWRRRLLQEEQGPHSHQEYTRGIWDPADVYELWVDG
ncbi:hypothetical protein ACQ86N_17885 [Puia sp. P3]|uniref:hypothetical protein n=1 Tax=Puia sp. P3 TaxID=3423952 RepID=UPI003D677475